MSEVQRTQGLEVDKYKFYTPEDKEMAEKEAQKAWNQRKLKKVIYNDYILSYQELHEMRLVYSEQLQTAKEDLEILQEKVEATKVRIKEYENKVKEWDKEIEQAKKDVPEIGEKAAIEERQKAENEARHKANLEGKGKGKAYEVKS